MFIVETLAAARFKTLRGQNGKRWSTLMFCLFPALFLLGFVHPLLWATTTVMLEIYILYTLTGEFSLRNAAIRNRQQEATALKARAEAGE